MTIKQYIIEAYIEKIKIETEYLCNSIVEVMHMINYNQCH